MKPHQFINECYVEKELLFFPAPHIKEQEEFALVNFTRISNKIYMNKCIIMIHHKRAYACSSHQYVYVFFFPSRYKKKIVVPDYY